MSDDELVRLFWYMFTGSFISSGFGFWSGYRYGRKGRK